MKYPFFFLAIIIFAVFSLYQGCKDTISGTELDNKTIPDKNVSFSANLQTVFEVKCASSGCHDDGTRSGGIALTTWSGVTNPEILVPYKPENSKLVWSIERLAGIQPMPPLGYPALTNAQLTGIKTWIQEGAKNN